MKLNMKNQKRNHYHISNLKRTSVEWRKCETCNVDTKSPNWEKQINTKKHFVTVGNIPQADLWSESDHSQHTSKS